MKPNHQKAEDKYSKIREQALKASKENLPLSIRDKIDFRGIDREALLVTQLWETSNLRKNLPWSFSRNYSQWAFRHPDRLDLAVWFETNLCSLAIGFPTKTGQSMRLDVIEKNPCSYPLTNKIFEINIIAFAEFADRIGANRIKIMRPLNEKLIAFYRSYGFIYQKSKGSDPEHLWKFL